MTSASSSLAVAACEHATDIRFESSTSSPMHMTPDFRSIGANLLVELAISRGATWQTLVQSIPCLLGSPREADLFKSHANYSALVDTVSVLFNGTDIGLEWGHRSGVSALSVFGLALMGTATVEDLLHLWTQYKTLLPEGKHITHTTDRGLVTLHRPNPSPRRLSGGARLLMERHLAWCATNLQMLTAGRCRAAVCRIPWPAPPYAAKYSTIADHTEFRSERLELVFPQSVLELPVLCGGSSAMVEHFRARLDQQLMQHSPTNHFSAQEKISDAMERSDGTIRTRKDVSALLGTSQRTVRRMLDAEGTSYRAMVRQAKMKRAERLLTESTLSIEQISEMSGFDNTQSFRQAFRQWRGMAPSEWRQQQRRQPTTVNAIEAMQAMTHEGSKPSSV